MCRTALTHPGAQRDPGGADRLGDVDDAVAVENRELVVSPDSDGQRVASGWLCFTRSICALVERASRAMAKTEPVLAPIGELLDESLWPPAPKSAGTPSTCAHPVQRRSR